MDKTLAGVKIDPKRVTAVYYGKPGCACGCRGKYAFASIAESVKSGDHTANDRSVRRIVSNVQRMLDNPPEGMTGENLDAFLWIETPVKAYTVYFDAR